MSADSAKVRVLIATTSGPIEIERIEEIADAIPQSVVLVSRNGGGEDLGPVQDDEARILKMLSARYTEFTARGSGIVADIYGHERFRLHLSDLIHEGASWQLGVFLAHALHAAGDLARKDEPADMVVLATGKVKHDQSVTDIGSLDAKLKQAIGRLEAESAAGRRIFLMWPDANDSDVDVQRRQQLEKFASILALDRTAPALQALGLHPIQTTRAADRWEGSPFRGLEPFDEDHHDIFFGRGAATDEAFDILQREAARDCAFLLVHGGSGAGKSSLARAGLIPAVKRQAPQADEWRSCLVLLGAGDGSSAGALAEAMKKAIPELAVGEQSLSERLRRKPLDAVEQLVRTLNGVKPTGRVKLIAVIDQLEQFLAHSEDRDAFAEAMSALARSGAVWLIATIRSDKLGLLDEVVALSTLASSNRMYRLKPPGYGALREIVCLPARLAGIEFAGSDRENMKLEDILVQKALARESLPLLEFVLDKLYTNEAAGTGKITFEAYERLGGLEGAIGRLADQVMGRFGGDPVRARSADAIVLELGRFDTDTNSVTARSLTLSPSFLAAIGGGAEDIIQALVDARLVVRDRADNGATTVRVAHEAVLNKWPHALQLFKDRVKETALRDHLEYEAGEWESSGRDDERLMPDGGRLRDAQLLLDQSVVPSSIRSYVEASSRQSERVRDRERARQAELIDAQQATIRGQREKIRWIATLCAALSLVLIAAAVQIGSFNLAVSGDSIFSPGPFRQFQSALRDTLETAKNKLGDKATSNFETLKLLQDLASHEQDLRLLLKYKQDDDRLSVATIKDILGMPHEERHNPARRSSGDSTPSQGSEATPLGNR